MVSERPAGSVPPARPRVAAVVLNWNQAELTTESVGAVRGQVDHVFVVDNDSRPTDRELLARLVDSDTTLVVNPRNLGYAGGSNEGVFAAVRASFDAILIMNNDAFPDPGSIRALRDRLAVAPTVAAVGPAVVERHTRRVLHADCSLDPDTGRAEWARTGAQLESLGTDPLATGYISGEAMLVRREAVEQIGMFDPRYFCYYEDVDWGIRAARAGWRLEVVPTAIFEHVGGATSSGYVGTSSPCPKPASYAADYVRARPTSGAASVGSARAARICRPPPETETSARLSRRASRLDGRTRYPRLR